MGQLRRLVYMRWWCSKGARGQSLKTISLALTLCLSATLLSCNRSEKDRLTVGTLPGAAGASGLGTISLAQGNAFSSPSPSQSRSGSTPHLRKGLVTIEAIDITKDGIDWIPLLVSSLTVTVTDDLGFVTQLGVTPKSVLPGEYHGVRIIFAPNPVFLDPIIPDGLLNPYPWISPFLISDSQGTQGIGSEALLTSANGYLVPFRVESGKNLFLVVGLEFSRAGNIPEWYLGVGAKATTILP